MYEDLVMVLSDLSDSVRDLNAAIKADIDRKIESEKVLCGVLNDIKEISIKIIGE